MRLLKGWQQTFTFRGPRIRWPFTNIYNGRDSSVNDNERRFFKLILDSEVGSHRGNSNSKGIVRTLLPMATQFDNRTV